jgi:ABC-2 type transport system permease protein
MSKTLLIIKREYLTRVKNKTFLLTTILTPLFFIALIVGSAYFSSKGRETLTIAVTDANGFFKGNLKSSGDLQFDFPEGVDTSNYLSKGYSAILLIPKFEGTAQTDYIIRSKKGIGMMAKGHIENKVNAAIEDHMLQLAGLQRNALDSIHQESQFASLKAYQEKGDTAAESNQGLAYGIAYASGFLIYITMFIYGIMLMRGVMEEKVSRIAEVIISSVKPFQLMVGKIIGIGAVGITQLLLWIVLIATLYFCVEASEAAQKFADFKHLMSTANWPVIIGCFLFYFLGGYLFYAALFAAAGSAVEDVQNSQSLTMPITMPIIFSFIIMTTTVNAPDSPIAVWASIIPFSSPIVMMARVAYGVPGTVPYWQLIASMASLIAGFLFTTWLASKIYRTGILMYGKKVTWKEMIRWAFRKA